VRSRSRNEEQLAVVAQPARGVGNEPAFGDVPRTRGPLLQSENEAGQGGADTDLPARSGSRLLAELLALNFHEHFELGPLLRYVDTLPGQTEDARTRLRSTSPPRDLAPARATAVDGRRPGRTQPVVPRDLAQFRRHRTRRQAALVRRACDSRPASGSLALNCSSMAQGTPLRIESPDGRDHLQVNIRAVSWAAQTVGIYSVLLGANGESQAHTPRSSSRCRRTRFRLGQHVAAERQSLRHLPDAHRRHPGVARIMRLSFVWFPKDFVPPRERPFDLDVHEAVPDVKAPLARK
jgi:hypothetical protein